MSTSNSSSKLALFKKLHSLQKEIGALKKDKSNPHFKSSYTDINGIIEHLQPLLEKNGLLLLQPITEGVVYSIIVDVDTGEQIESYLTLPTVQNPQHLGSAVTYYRRYTLQSLLGLMAEDDDGNAAAGKPAPQKQIEEPKYYTLSKQKFNSLIAGEDIDRLETAIKYSYSMPLDPGQMSKLKDRLTELIDKGIEEANQAAAEAEEQKLTESEEK